MDYILDTHWDNEKQQILKNLNTHSIIFVLMNKNHLFETLNFIAYPSRLCNLKVRY